MNRVFRSAALLPHLPEVVMELDRVTRGEGRAAHEIAAVVSKDPVIAGKVLRLANSAFYARKGPVSSLEHALRLVGMSDFRTMVIASGASAAVGDVSGMDLRSYWTHGALAGYMSAAITDQGGGRDSGMAFIAGLLHSIGSVLIHMVLPKQAREIDGRSTSLDFLNRATVEQEVLGFDHAQVGGELLRRWRLPDSVVTAVTHYPRKSLSDGRLAVVVHCGSVCATGSMQGVPVEDICEIIGAEALRELGVDQSWLGQELTKNADQAEGLAAVLS